MSTPALAEPPARVAKAYTARNIAEMLQCSTRQVWRWRDAGIMPEPIKIGSIVRWNADLIDEWIAKGCPSCRKGR